MNLGFFAVVGMLTFICQLPTGSINIFSPASSHPYIHPVFYKMVSKLLGGISSGLVKLAPSIGLYSITFTR